MLGTILIVLLVVALLGGFRDYGGGPGYGYGNTGLGVVGVLLAVVLVLALTGNL